MRKLKNRTKSALALLLSAAMTVGTMSVGWAAEEEVVVVDDVEITGQSETIPALEDLLSGISQNELSVEKMIVEEEKLSAESASEPVQPEVPEASELEIPKEEKEPEIEILGTGEKSEVSGTETSEVSGEESLWPKETEIPEMEKSPETPEPSETEQTQPEAEKEPETPETEEGQEEENQSEKAKEQLEEVRSDTDPETLEQTETVGEDSEIKMSDDGETAAAAESEDNYRINLWDGNNSVYELLPGEQMDLFVEVWKDGEENPLDPSEYKLTWKSSNKEAATIKPDKDHAGLESGQQCATVTAAENLDQSKENKTVITVKAVIGSVTKTETRDIYVHDGIWVITPRDDYGIRLYPGQSWKSGKPKMTYYELGKEPQVKDNIKFEWVYNPDENGKDTYGEEEPVSLKRGKNGGLTVTAEEFNGKNGECGHIDLVATDPENPDFRVSGGFEFEVMYYNEKNLQNNIEGPLYVGDSAAFTVNPDLVDGRLTESSPTVEWEVLEYDEASDKNKPSDNASVKPVSGNKYKAKVTYKKAGSYAVCAKLKIDGKTAGEVWSGNYEVRGETKEYRQRYANDMIPGYTICLEDQSRYYVDNADNPDMEYMLQYQGIKSSDPYVVSVRTENDGKTILQAENKGTAKITGTMIWVDSKGKSHEEDFEVTLYVSDEVYRADLYVKSGGERMFPEDTRQLVLDVWKEEMGSTKKLGAKKYTVEWKNYDKNVLKVGSKGKVTAKKYGETNVTAEITIKKSGYKFQADCWFGVTDGYFNMVPKSIEKNLYPGDVVSLETPSVYWYEQGKDPVVRKDVEFEWRLNPDENRAWNDLDTNIYSLESDEDHNIRSVTVNRMPTQREYEAGKNNLHIEVHAKNSEKSFEMTSEEFDFRVNYVDGRIESEDQENFTGGEQKLTWNGDFQGDSGDLKIKWNIRGQVWDDEKGDFVDAGEDSAASVSAEGKGKTATLKFIKSGDGKGRVFVSATALYKGTEIGSTDEREYYFRFPVVFPEKEYILNEEVVYRIENETYPMGQAFPVTEIKNAEIVQQEAADPAKENEVLKLTEKADGKIALEGLNSGRALVRGEFTAKIGEETVKEIYEDWYYVESVTYDWRLVNDKGSYNALPGSSLKFSVNFWKQTAAGSSLLGKNKYTCTWELREGVDIADLSGKGKLKIHKDAKEGSYINVYVKFELKSDKNVWGEESFDVRVTNTYDNIEVSDITVREGETAAVKPVLKWYNEDYPDGYTEKDAKFTYKADPSVVQRIKVKGKKITGLKAGTQDLIISTEKNGQKIEKRCTVTVNP